jgi:excisionase family DNA binding protein
MDTGENNGAILEFLKRIPVKQIAPALAFLSARLLAEGQGNDDQANPTDAAPIGVLLTAKQLAERLNVPESWVRTEQRAGRIPAVRLRKYARFDAANLENALVKETR